MSDDTLQTDIDKKDKKKLILDLALAIALLVILVLFFIFFMLPTLESIAKRSPNLYPLTLMVFAAVAMAGIASGYLKIADRNKYNIVLNEEIVKIFDKENGKYIELLNFIESYKLRLNYHIQSLIKNRDVNLIIGLVITAISIALLLIFFIFNYDLKQNDDLVFYYASRFTVVVSIEIFSLFFLKLYSTNLFEIKYFQNELSNVESKIIALKTAMLVEQPELIAEVVKELVKTERNYILRKDETTVDLERTKLEKEDNKHLLDSLLQTIKDLKSK
jgi:hypothetical protein